MIMPTPKAGSTACGKRSGWPIHRSAAGDTQARRGEDEPDHVEKLHADRAASADCAASEGKCHTGLLRGLSRCAHTTTGTAITPVGQHPQPAADRSPDAPAASYRRSMQPSAAARTITTRRTITHLFMGLRIIDPSWFVRWRTSILAAN